MNTHHTPGPWHVEPDQPSHGCALCIVDKEGTVIARTPTVPHYEHPEQAQDEINARLIVAAPELLETAAQLLAEYDRKFGKLVAGTTAFADAYLALHNAIAKATQP